MARIPFDDRVMTPKLQAASGRYDTGAAQAITGRAQTQLAQQVGGAVQQLGASYDKHLKAQDESDMVAARAAHLRLQKNESAELQKASNGDEIKKINESYKKQYEAISSGKDSFDRPTFRNESGRNSFKEQFSDGFNLKRDLAAADQTTRLDRRNTNARFLNGIKAVSESDYFAEPRAELEISQYVDKQVENGFYTVEEGKAKLDAHLGNLDIERASRKILDISMVPMRDFDGSGIQNPIEAEVTQYKKYVDSLKYMPPQQKAKFKAAADSRLSVAKSATKAQDAADKAEAKQTKQAHSMDISEKIARQELTVDEALADKNLTNELRKDLIDRLGRMNKAKAKEQTPEQRAKLQATAINLVSLANRYDREADPTSDHGVHLIQQISESAMDEKVKTDLIGKIRNGRKLPPGKENERKNLIKELDRIAGLDAKSFEFLQTIKTKRIKTEGYVFNDYYQKAYIDPKTGKKMVDGLDEFTRQKSVDAAIADWEYMTNLGKGKEADEKIRKFMTDMETSDNDIIFNDVFIKRRSRYLDQRIADQNTRHKK